ncbi:MAG: hypothetical protein IKO10_00415 [Lachnospiraceae bacterium]|nr:hypothetical protein [Lachnospiraceae bacterium]
MKKEQMAICDTDGKYVYRLQELLEQRDAFPFAISVFTEPERIAEEKIGEMAEKYRLILAGEAFYEKLQKAGVKEMQMLLLKGAEELPQVTDYIWKYQSGDRIRQQIMEFFSEHISDGFTENEKGVVPYGHGRQKGSLIGIFSPACRELQSSFSVLLGQHLSRQANVLYLNFESFSGLSKLLEATDGRDLTDLVYYMEGGRERLVYKLESMVGNWNGLDYVSPAFSFVDLGEIREDSWMLLLKTLQEMGHYDYILLDLSENIHGVLNILRQCAKVYTLSNGEEMSQTRMAHYEELLRKLDYEDVLQNTTKCDLPVFQKSLSATEELPRSEMAVYVRELVREEYA